MPQTYTGQVRNGVIVLDAGTPPLPESTRVRVELVDPHGTATPSLSDRLGSVVGIARGLPADFAAQHDHYIHGTPKR
jgi:hypothetical protein